MNPEILHADDVRNRLKTSGMPYTRLLVEFVLGMPQTWEDKIYKLELTPSEQQDFITALNDFLTSPRASKRDLLNDSIADMGDRFPDQFPKGEVELSDGSVVEGSILTMVIDELKSLYSDRLHSL